MEKEEKSFYDYIGKVDYKYYKNRSMQCIIDPDDKLGGLYLGNSDGAEDLCSFLTLKIKSVICCAAGFDLHYPKEYIENHYKISAEDSEDYDIKQHFEKAIEFIDNNRKIGSVYVHCLAGISRSATIVIAYLMKNGKMNFCEAAKYVQSQRSCIYPNFGFCKQLIEYEKELDLLKEKLTESNLS